MKLPLPVEELILSLNERQDIPLTKDRVRVIDVAVTRHTSGEPMLEVQVEASIQGGPAQQRWIVKLPQDAELFEADVLPQAFVAVVRANIDEWWMTKESEPLVASRGRRILG